MFTSFVKGLVLDKQTFQRRTELKKQEKKFIYIEVGYPNSPFCLDYRGG